MAKAGGKVSAAKPVIDEADLRRQAKEALKNAYSKYSGFSVGAALLTAKGSVYLGCNVESVSYGLTNCAERVAIGNAVVAEGAEMRIAAIAIAARGTDTEGLSDASPCGACRQVIKEFAAQECPVYYRFGGNDVMRTIGELLVDNFDK